MMRSKPVKPEESQKCSKLVLLRTMKNLDEIWSSTWLHKVEASCFPLLMH